jgi:Flp pilus assembly protein CpaB
VRQSLDPSLWGRLLDGWRPDWSRTVAARRTAAAGLVVLAAVAAFRPDPGEDRVDVVVAARDLRPGHALDTADVRVESRAAAGVPDGAHVDPAAVVGATLAGPVRRGEVLTDVRVLGARSAEAAAGPNARLVPLRLEDPALVDLIRPGDVVDVLVAGADGAAPEVVASGAVVVLVSPAGDGFGATDERVVLVATPARDATRAAGAALQRAVTLTLH